MREEIKFYNSISFKILSILSLGIILSVCFTILSSIPEISTHMENTTQDYMIDEAKAYGLLLDSLIRQHGTDILEDQPVMSGYLSNIKIHGLNSSYAYLVNHKGTMLYHPAKEKIGQPVENTVVKNIIKSLSNGTVPKPDCICYKFRGKEKYASYYVDGNKSYILVISADRDDVFTPIRTTTTKMIAIGLITLFILQLIGYFVVKAIVRPIRAITAIINKVAGLDFSTNQELDVLNRRKDEMGTISRAIGNLHTKLSLIISNISNQSNKVSQSSSQFNEGFSSIVNTIYNINSSVEEIADGSTRQASEVVSANNLVVESSNSVNTSCQHIEELKHSIQKMNSYATEANDEFHELIKICNKTSANIQEILTQTNATNNSVNKIKDAVILIQEIAEQTNLLSLNASIEAARAGEAGKGFSVVAEEIRKLSEDSSSSADVINEIVKELINNSNISVTKMGEVNHDANIQISKLTDTKNSFDGLGEEITSVSHAFNCIFSEIQNLQGINSSVSDVVNQLATLATQNASSSEDTSANMQTLSSTIETCKAETDQLAALSIELNQEVQKFTW